ncbi:MAG: preprotein translocase subunit SecE [Alphaproteobacteria bacterium]|jgi:preprotein translocase subunit SecE
MKKVLKFFNDVRQELSKVTWLSRKEASTSTVMVVVVVGIFSLVFAAADYIIYSVVQFVVNLGV